MPGVKTTTLIGVAVVLAIVAALALSLVENSKRQSLYSINSFDECAAAGYPIMESYPEQCATPDGRTFVNEKQAPQTSNDGISFNECAVAGCSAHLCVSADEAAEIVSTCEYRSEYACYREASCEPQANGKCGWTQTEELKQCLKNPPPLSAAVEPVF